MTEPTSQMPQTPPTPPTRRTDNWMDPGKLNVQIIYVLYLASFVIGITAVVGVVFAYLNRGKSDPWLETHYTWAIRTFWIGILYVAISVVLTLALVGVILAIATAVWVIVRCVIGLQRVSNDQPIERPESWLI
ncbi:DUF4870 family protein [Ciceribacter ferrooxidans]|uniref:Transmembrane protein n=1 Tax=Ciceribacter ferrooxidans TaxID=2509717 RepID=A0A4V1RLU2_9HYPH|nr:DUF4870 domain-containing protein [Ciceribacter ferrooxidans]RYB97010.1 hypothetical protein EUU22_23710 [Ciceribacter ferrooxidans]